MSQIEKLEHAEFESSSDTFKRFKGRRRTAFFDLGKETGRASRLTGDFPQRNPAAHPEFMQETANLSAPIQTGKLTFGHVLYNEQKHKIAHDIYYN